MPKTLREVYFESFVSNCLKAAELTKKKNEGYTAGSNDPYSNFRFAAGLATLPGKDELSVEQTILSRMADKISRFKSLTVRPGAATYDETIEDTLMDLFVYANILLTYVQLGRPAGDTEYLDAAQELSEPTAFTAPAAGIVEKAGEALKQFFNWKAPTVTK